ncbi:MAG: HAD family hydrolase, partial [Lachnospiraceae bacterium]|nr:HAD family hydrolase [Lachnospiraceae bacterium]
LIIVTDKLGGVLFRKPNDISFRIMKYCFDVEYQGMIYIRDNIRKDFIVPKTLRMKWIWYYNSEGIYREEQKVEGSLS